MPPKRDRERHHGVEPLHAVFAEAVRRQGKSFLKYDEVAKAQKAKTLPGKLVAAKHVLHKLRKLN